MIVQEGPKGFSLFGAFAEAFVRNYGLKCEFRRGGDFYSFSMILPLFIRAKRRDLSSFSENLSISLIFGRVLGVIFAGEMLDFIMVETVFQSWLMFSRI